MPKGQVTVIEYQNQPMSLREFADAVGIAHKTVQGRWNRGYRTVEDLGRAADKRFSSLRQQQPKRLRKAKTCVNSLLAGWKSVTGVSDLQTVSTPSAECS
jgi:hypothetical protein